MAGPSNLKVKRVDELDALPSGVHDAAWMYVVHNNKDYKTTIADVAADVGEVVIDELEQPDGSDLVGFNLELTNTVDRLVGDKLREIPSVKDFGVVGNGVTDDTANALLAADSGISVHVPAGTYNLSQDVYVWGSVDEGALYSGAGRFYTIKDVLEQGRDFLVRKKTDERNRTSPLILNRGIEIRALTPTTVPYYEELSVARSSSSIGLALLALCDYTITSPSITGDTISAIEVAADFLVALQYSDPLYARYGGFMTTEEDARCTCFSAGTAGRGLLAAYKLTGDAKYFEACRKAVQFLKVLKDPNPVYQSLYSETPIPAEPENAGFTGFCDRIGVDDAILITATDWNLVAALFLQEFYEMEADPDLPDIIADVVDFQKFGVFNGYDYFAIKNTSPGSKVSITWPNFSGHAYADGAWHRLGDPSNTGTVGTDQMEYGFYALHKLNYDISELRQYYVVYRDLAAANAGSTSFGDAYDGAICWPGYFRINSPTYGGAGGHPIDPATSRAFGDYYDLQGAGTLLQFKKQEFPVDYAKSLRLTVLAPKRGFGTDENFNTLWSTGSGYSFYTKGTIPIVKSMQGLIESTRTIL